MSVSLSNVVRVSVLGPSKGLSRINTSALAIITDEVPIGSRFDSKVYLNSIGVAKDFGVNSKTYGLVNTIFSQRANVITGGGYVVVIPRIQSAAAAPAVLVANGPVDLNSLAAEDYVIRGGIDGGPATDFTIGKIDRSDVETVEDSLNTQEIKDAGIVFTVSGEMTNATVKVSTISTGANSRVVIGPAQIDGSDLSGALNLKGEGTGADAGVERIKECLLRTMSSESFIAVVYTSKLTGVELLELGSLVQGSDMIQIVGSNLESDLEDYTAIKNNGYTKTRCLFYSTSSTDALTFAAGYASTLLSMNFDASNSALTMNLKDFIGLEADPKVDDSMLDKTRKAGVDVLASIGVPKIFSTGGNQFADQVFTRLAVKIDMQIAGINFLAQTNTKIPQTEEGMDGLKGAYRRVLDRFVAAGVFAPGSWTDSTTFGTSPEDHRRNIEETGYFIYSSPVALQDADRRKDRIAPIIQIGIKEAGAIHSSDVIILVDV